MRLAAALGFIALASDPLSAQCAPDVQKRLDARQLTVATAMLEARVARDSSDDRAWHCLGRVALAEDDPARAIEHFDHAVARRPDNAEHHVALGLALRLEASRQGMMRAPSLMRRAIQELETGVRLDSAQADAHYVLLQFYAKVPEAFGGSIEKATAHQVALRGLDPVRAQQGAALIADQKKVPRE